MVIDKYEIYISNFHATMPYYGNPWFVALTENYLFRTN